jgi:NAD(P)H-nitrite reductase large subunit
MLQKSLEERGLKFLLGQSRPKADRRRGGAAACGIRLKDGRRSRPTWW